MKPVNKIAIIAFASLLSSTTWAQEMSETMDHSGHTMDSDQMDHSEHTMGADQMDHSGHSGPAAAATQTDAGADTEDLRDPHAYSEGEDFGPLGQPRLADEHNFGAVLIHRLESVNTDENSSFAFEGQGWYGRTYDRLNVKLEVDADSGKVEDARTEVLWSHAIASFWDT